MGTSTGEFIAALTADHDVIVIGGLAVIAHGFNRPTKDADIWLAPMSSPGEWAEALERTCGRFAGLSLHTPPGWRKVSGAEVALAAEEVGMVRVSGLECPLDVFRRPNEFEAESFGEVRSRATRNADGTWLPDPLDLAISKNLTNRDQDFHDVTYLESLVRSRWVEQLPTADAETARGLFDRYVDWRTCQAAMQNPDETVREMAMAYLRELAAEGDPFSRDLVEGREIP